MRAPDARQRVAAAAFAVLFLIGFSPAATPAQVGDTTQVPVDSVVVSPEARPTVTPTALDSIQPISPRGAFVRSALIPGWGQSAFGSYFRGGIYFAGWTGNWFMMFKNQVRLNQARDRFDLRARQIEEELIAASPNPDSLRAVLDTVPSVLDQAIRADDGPGASGNALRRLVGSREQQREDWIAWSIFWLLASGLDAYVTAQLADFPTDVDVRRNADRTVSVGIQVPIPGKRP